MQDNTQTDEVNYNELFDADVHLEKQENDFNNPLNDVFGKDEISFVDSFKIEDQEDEIVDLTKQQNSDSENKEEDNDDLFKEASSSKEDQNNQQSDFDIEVFNKKFGKNFKSEEEVKNFFEGKQENQKEETTLEDNIAEVSNIVSILQETIDLSDKDLMREQLKNEAKKAGKDVNNEDVQIEIEDELDELESNRVLDTKASLIRLKLEQVLNIKNQEKNSLISKKQQIISEKENSEKQKLQGALVEFLNKENFYGMKLSKEIVSDVYKEIRSNKFLESIKNDPKELAELALMKRFKENIYKKASGKTYADGMKAILDEFKIREKDNPIVRAQRKGSSGASDNSKDLIDSILFEKSKEKE